MYRIGDDWLSICKTVSLLEYSLLLVEPIANGKCKIRYHFHNITLYHLGLCECFGLSFVCKNNEYAQNKPQT
jgi:hypothetical protein